MSCSTATTPDESSGYRTHRDRVLLMVAGSGLASYGYLHTVAARLGNGPLFAVQDGLSRRFGVSLAVSALVLGLALVGLAAVLRAPLGIGTVAVPVLNAVWISVLESSVAPWTSGAGRWIQFLGGTGVMMFGAVLTVAAWLGAAAMDGVMFGLARRLAVTPARARLGLEVTFAVTGAVIGGRVGVGTVVMGATVGHLFQFWSRFLTRLGLDVVPAPVDERVPDTERWAR